MSDITGNNDVAETYKFQAEINQLMSLIINTFYSNKDIFLRELISNSSDALDKIRHNSLVDKSVLDSNPDLSIKIIPDRNNKTLTILDSGIGMTKDELIKNLGTIAQSGTKNFMEALENSDTNLIGQFGVGFYSAYLVSDRVVVTSKNNADDQYVWESSAGGSFTVKKSNDKNLMRGTEIVCYLKEDQLHYTEEQTLRSLINKHSEYTNYPLYLSVEKTVEEVVEVDDDDELSNDKNDDRNNDKNDEPIIEDVEEDENSGEKEKKTKTISKTTIEDVLVNKQKPIWTKKPIEITQEEYTEFYKNLTKQTYESPMAYKHFSVEGQLEFTGLLYLPTQPPFELFDKDKKKRNISLYVKRVFITDDCEEFVPEWLSFIKGIVDSEDLPLNISREVLQQNKVLKVIKKNIVKKSIELFFDLLEDKEKYMKFYNNYSKNIKLGVHEDSSNRAKLADLLLYESRTTKPGEVLTFKDYVENMPSDQKDIYYITGESRMQVEKSPFLEMFAKKNYDVLFLTEPMDEYCIQQLNQYDGKNLVCITKDGLKLDDNDKNENEVKEYNDLCNFIKETIGDKLEKCVISNRIVQSPCCLVTNEYGWTANMERIMKAQALRDNSMSMHMKSKKIMEINPKHKIIKGLKNKLDADKNDRTVRDLIFMLYESSLLVSGFNIDDPSIYVNRIYHILSIGLQIDPNEDTNDEDTNDDTNDEKTNDEETNEETNEENTSSMEKVD